MTALSCDDLAAQLATADTPVLLLDTCTILDVVRAPVRNQLGVHDIQAVHTLMGRTAGAPPTVSFVITEQVLQEFRDHIEAVETEALNALKKAANEFAGILKRIRALCPGDRIPGAVDLLSLGLPQRGRNLSEQIIQTSFILADHDDEVVKAYDRVRLAKPPSTRARQSVKDCLIAESYLRIAATLHTGGFARNVVFATSNIGDYQQGHSSLHPELRAEFDSACLEYAPSWAAARHELDRYRTPLPARNSK